MLVWCLKEMLFLPHHKKAGHFLIYVNYDYHCTQEVTSFYLAPCTFFSSSSTTFTASSAPAPAFAHASASTILESSLLSVPHLS